MDIILSTMLDTLSVKSDCISKLIPGTTSSPPIDGLPGVTPFDIAVTPVDVKQPSLTDTDLSKHVPHTISVGTRMSRYRPILMKAFSNTPLNSRLRHGRISYRSFRTLYPMLTDEFKSSNPNPSLFRQASILNWNITHDRNMTTLRQCEPCPMRMGPGSLRHKPGCCWVKFQSIRLLHWYNLPYIIGSIAPLTT